MHELNLGEYNVISYDFALSDKEDSGKLPWKAEHPGEKNGNK